jgi:peptide/nickel transport system permease protein
MTWREALREVLASGPGKAGLALFALLLAISIYVLMAYPLDFGPRRWSNPAVWADNPKAAPPAWTNWFSATRRVPHTTWATSQPSEMVPNGPGETRLYRFPVEFTYDEAPTFLSFSLGKVLYHGRPPLVSVTLERPDGATVLLYREQVRGPRPGEESPYVRYQDTPLRVLLSQEALAASDMARLLQSRYGVEVAESRLLAGGLKEALFGEPSGAQEGAFQPLRGKYTARIEVAVADPKDQVGEVKFVMGGSVYGIMGTDTLGRDLREGLLFGFPIALTIAIVASTLTTVIGASLGIISGYTGGRTDLIIQRVADIVSNVPVLPLLIFLVFILGSNLFIIILLLVAFSWPGLTILLRSMVLQVRSGQLVEAALSMGASRWRIMYRHVFPTTAPFVLAQMIFFAPSAILAEAALSFLGLGDPTLPTWGQILEAGFRTGAIYIGYWWWIIPPGVLIVVTAMAFMFLALATEPVVNPRLRRMT